MDRREFCWRTALASTYLFLADRGLRAIDAPTLGDIPEMRTMTSATWSRGEPGKFHTLIGMRPKFYPTNPQAWLADKKGYRGWEPLRHLNPEIVEGPNGDLTTDCGWYTVTINARVPAAMRFESILGGSVSMAMTGLDLRRTAPMRIVEGWRWENVARDFDVELHFKATGAEFFKRRKSARAPLAWGWEGQKSADFTGRMNWNIKGWDNEHGTAKRFADEMRLRRHRRVQIAVDVQDLGDGRFAVREVLSGKVIELQPVTRHKHLTDDSAYPWLIDADVDVAVTADADDVQESQQADTVSVLGSVYGNLCRQDTLGYGHVDGWRWLNIAMDNAVTIDDATQTIQATRFAAGGVNATVKFDLVGDAVAWDNTHRPTQIAPTSSGGTVDLTTTGAKAADVKNPIQEVVNHAGWASGNDMRASLTATDGAGVGAADVGDLTDSVGAVESTLAINWTAGGGPPATTKTGMLLGV